MLEPVSVALKFGFLAVLYLFLLWVVAQRAEGPAPRRRPARRAATRRRRRRPTRPACTPPRRSGGPADELEPRLVVERAPGHTPGMEYDIGEGAVMGRGDQAEIRLEDPFASSRHAQLYAPGRRSSCSRTSARPTAPTSTRSCSPGRSRCTPATACASATASSPTSSRADAARRRARRAHRHGPPAPGQRGRLLRALAAVRRSPTGWAARRPARSRRATAVEAFERRPARRAAAARRSAWPALVQEANERIHELAQADSERAGMGTTLTAAYVAEGDVAIAHVGDSRLYRLRDGELERLTEDHTLVDELERQGKITAEEAGRAPAALDHHPRAGRRARRRGRPRTPGPRATATSS